MTLSSFPKETKFIDLPAEMRANLESLEKSIRQFSDQSAALACRNYDDTHRITEDVAKFYSRVVTCETANETCRGQILSAKRIMNQYWKYGESTARMIIASKQTGPDGTVKWVPVLAPTNLGLLDEMIGSLESQLVDLVDVSAVRPSECPSRYIYH